MGFSDYLFQLSKSKRILCWPDSELNVVVRGGTIDGNGKVWRQSHSESLAF